eukprot:TRINITY_DN8726_c0_g1_i1.p1 TRINITY_DN8726_c0_g1~~TRINITY_DN8726_c0_g1_i1.p1  ORF type:complete len:259 (+),score=34.86 TRINITY_DN8726_c0_g1_i1:435-1211(+)
MLRISSGLRVVGRLLSCVKQNLELQNGSELLIRSAESSRQFGQFVPVRCLSSIVGKGGPSLHKLVDKELNLPFRNMHIAIQNRQFLSGGDGEGESVLSKTYEERRVMGYSPEQLFAVVAAVDLYEDFVPWCQRSEIFRRHDDGTFDAELEIGFKFLVESYVSRVEVKKPTYIKTTATDTGLFDHLINIWEFNPGPVPGTCNLYFLVDFKFNSPLYRQVASLFFKEVATRLVSSFSDRCRMIYGPGVRVLENSYGEQRI